MFKSKFQLFETRTNGGIDAANESAYALTLN